MADLRLALIAFVLFSFVPSQSEAHPVEPTRVLLVGDSITWGDVGGDPDFPPYAVVLQEMLGRKKFEVVNAGCGGSTILDWTDPTPLPAMWCGFAGAFESKAVPLLPADIMTVMLGSNDSTGFFEFGCDTPGSCPVSVEVYYEHLILLVALAKMHGVRRIILSGPPPIVNATQSVWLRLEGYRIVTEQVCLDDQQVLCTDSLLKELDSDDYDYTDDVHPNVDGHRKIAKEFKSIVRRARREVLHPLGRGVASSSHNSMGHRPEDTGGRPGPRGTRH